MLLQRRSPHGDIEPHSLMSARHAATPRRVAAQVPLGAPHSSTLLLLLLQLMLASAAPRRPQGHEFSLSCPIGHQVDISLEKWT
jgi:hypothetical protein